MEASANTLTLCSSILLFFNLMFDSHKSRFKLFLYYLRSVVVLDSGCITCSRVAVIICAYCDVPV